MCNGLYGREAWRVHGSAVGASLELLPPSARHSAPVTFSSGKLIRSLPETGGTEGTRKQTLRARVCSGGWGGQKRDVTERTNSGSMIWKEKAPHVYATA